eukprot:3871178-Prymnesium_polylepis.1
MARVRDARTCVPCVVFALLSFRARVRRASPDSAGSRTPSARSCPLRARDTSGGDRARLSSFAVDGPLGPPGAPSGPSLVRALSAGVLGVVGVRTLTAGRAVGRPGPRGTQPHGPGRWHAGWGTVCGCAPRADAAPATGRSSRSI